MTDIALIEALRDPRCYPHPAGPVHLVETHISWVLLTGACAYKIKKPLNLGFLDFGTLERRRFFCQEELRLNRRLAPDLYLGVVTINAGPNGPEVDGTGPVMEYAVKMRQFDQNGLLDRVQARGELNPLHVDALALQIGAFHRACDRAAAGGPFGSPEMVAAPARQNFEQIAALLTDPADRERLDRLAWWTESRAGALEAHFRARQRDGYVRECHGDLHLGNAFLDQGVIRIFDCIEFNAGLRWIDLMNDAAFMAMDLWHRNHPDLARRFLNAYLEDTGDYAGVATLDFYLVYRAMVRAKIALIRCSQPEVSQQEQAFDQSDFRRLVGLAEGFAARPRPWVAVTHGVSGSGKSRFALGLLERIDAVRVRSDVERKRGVTATGGVAGEVPVGGGLYSDGVTRSTYQRIACLTGAILDAGWPVIADATFLARWQRDLVREAARRRGVPVIVLDFHAPAETLRKRVAERAARGGDPSDANLAVLEHQMRTSQPLGVDERAIVFDVEADSGPHPEAVALSLAQLAHGPGAEV